MNVLQTLSNKKVSNEINVTYHKEFNQRNTFFQIIITYLQDKIDSFTGFKYKGKMKVTSSSLQIRI